MVELYWVNYGTTRILSVHSSFDWNILMTNLSLKERVFRSHWLSGASGTCNIVHIQVKWMFYFSSVLNPSSPELRPSSFWCLRLKCSLFYDSGTGTVWLFLGLRATWDSSGASVCSLRVQRMEWHCDKLHSFTSYLTSVLLTHMINFPQTLSSQ